MIDEAAQERATLYALGLLDAGEAAAFERELAADADLRALTAELRDTAAELAWTPEADPPPGLKARVLAQVAAESQSAGHPTRGKVVVGPWGRWLPWALAALLMICCGVLAANGLYWQREFDRANQKTAGLDAAVTHLIAATALPTPAITPADALRQVAFCPLEETHDESGRPRVAVLWDAARREGVLRVQKLPPPGEGKDYQLWAVEAGHKDTVSAGVVTLGEGGGVETHFRPVAEGGKDEVLAFAISLERAGGSPKNEGPVLFLGKL